MLKRPLRIETALRGQWLYAALVALWQLAGVVLVAMDKRPPGLSPSLVTAAVAIGFGVAFTLTAPRWPRVFALLALLTGAAAASTIRNAFTADPTLWPSDLARYAGVGINLVGLSAAFYSVAAVVGPSKKISLD